MRFLLSTALIALCTLAATWWMPWWTLAVVSAIFCFALEPRRAFWAGFLGVFLLWLSVGLARSVPNEHILSTRMAGVFKLPHWSMYLIVSALLGGLIGGLAGWSGVALRKALSGAQKSRPAKSMQAG